MTEADTSECGGAGMLSSFSDDALALRFADTAHSERKYVAKWNKWLHWTGSHWATDETLATFDEARRLCRAAAKTAKDGAKNIASGKTIAAVASLVRTDQRLAATAGQWDTHPLLLNTPAGTIDLKTGDTKPNDPGDYITQCCAVAPAPGACSVWRAFLDRIFDGDVQLLGFMQRALGYALTGMTSEHALFFLYGLGANGKSTLLDTVASILGDYHRVAPMEMLIASKQDRHPTEMAGLMGRRLVTAVETDKGRRWAEAKLKHLTGGGAVPARFMRGDFFEFTPQFKLFAAGNHKPTLNSVDEAIRRRFHLIPFTVTIPEGARDTALPEKLRAEWPQILHWLIEGCAEWREHGLAAPASVRAATNEYLDAQNTIQNWLNECTEEAPVEVPSAALYGSWREWCEANGEFPGTRKAFAQTLLNTGLAHRHTRTGWVFQGRRLAPLG